MKCAKCGKEMVLERRGKNKVINLSNLPEESVAIKVAMEHRGNEKPEVIAFMQKQMGKYELNKSYLFCFECLLDVLMK